MNPTRPVILFMHTVELSRGFVSGQLDYFADYGFEVHYAAALDDPSGPTTPGVWHLPLVRPPSPVADLRALVATYRLMRRLRPDVVHAGTPKAGLIGMVAARLARVPVRIYAVHGLRYESASGRLRTLLLAMERIASRAATVVLADSASVAGRLVDDLHIEAALVTVAGPGSSNGVDIARFRAPIGGGRQAARATLGLRTDVPVIGFVGRLVKDKGVDDLVRAHAALNRDREVQLLLVGPLEHDDAIGADTAARIAGGGAIVHVPWTSEPERAYLAMDVLAFPSYREGLPNAVLEAQAAGVPVVGYRATGTVDAAADATSLLPLGDVDGLTERLGQLIGNPARCTQLGLEASEWVKRFDRPRVWEARRQFVEQLLRSQRP